MNPVASNSYKVRHFLETFGQKVEDRPPKRPDKDLVVLGFRLIFEELLELLDEFDPEIRLRVYEDLDDKMNDAGMSIERVTKYNNYANILKELVDVEVVLHNLVNFLGLHEHYQICFEKVMENNMDKACRDEEHALETEHYYKDQGIDAYTTKPGLIVRRSSDHKILKPKGFVKFDPIELFTSQ